VAIPARVQGMFAAQSTARATGDNDGVRELVFCGL